MEKCIQCNVYYTQESDEFVDILPGICGVSMFDVLLLE